LLSELAVGALGQEDRAHAAAPDLSQDAVVSDFLTGARVQRLIPSKNLSRRRMLAW